MLAKLRHVKKAKMWLTMAFEAFSLVIMNFAWSWGHGQYIFAHQKNNPGK